MSCSEPSALSAAARSAATSARTAVSARYCPIAPARAVAGERAARSRASS